MPHVPPEQANHWATENAEVDMVVQLQGMARPDALARLEALLIETPPYGQTVRIEMDAPHPQSGQTLFQPVGQILLAARKAGKLVALRPLAPDGMVAGFMVEFAPQAS